MSGKNFRDFVRSAFDPICHAANRLDLIDRVYSAALPEARQSTQFEKFKKLKAKPEDALPLPSGGFLSKIGWGEDELLVISSNNLNETEWDNVRNLCTGELLFHEEEYDESTFLVACHELKGFLRLKSEFRSQSSSEEKLDIIDDEYTGHQIEDLMGLYSECMCFLVERDNIFFGKSITDVAVPILRQSYPLRSPIIDQEVAQAVYDIESAPGCASERLFLALTATQWRHSFLELYRCLEGLYFFPWLKPLKERAGISIPYSDLRIHLKKEILWNAKERDSIGKLFELIGMNEELERLENSIPTVKEITGNPDHTRRAVGERIYDIRNALVHFEDREILAAKAPEPSELRLLALHMAKVLKQFESVFGLELG